MTQYAITLSITLPRSMKIPAGGDFELAFPAQRLDLGGVPVARADTVTFVHDPGAQGEARNRGIDGSPHASSVRVERAYETVRDSDELELRRANFGGRERLVPCFRGESPVEHGIRLTSGLIPHAMRLLHPIVRDKLAYEAYGAGVVDGGDPHPMALELSIAGGGIREEFDPLEWTLFDGTINPCASWETAAHRRAPWEGEAAGWLAHVVLQDAFYWQLWGEAFRGFLRCDRVRGSGQRDLLRRAVHDMSTAVELAWYQTQGRDPAAGGDAYSVVRALGAARADHASDAYIGGGDVALRIELASLYLTRNLTLHRGEMLTQVYDPDLSGRENRESSANRAPLTPGAVLAYVRATFRALRWLESHRGALAPPAPS